MKFIAFCQRAYTLFIKFASLLQGPLLLVLRLYWGWAFFQAGWGKLTHLQDTAAFFATLNIPLPYVNAMAAASVECFGGLLLMVGLAARPAALALTFTMIVALVTAEKEALQSVFANPEKWVDLDKVTETAPFLFLLVSLIVVAFGPGLFSIDFLLKKFYWKKHLATNDGGHVG